MHEEEIENGSKMLANLTEPERKQLWLLLGEMGGLVRWIGEVRQPLVKSHRIQARRMIKDMDAIFKVPREQLRLDI